MAESATHLYEGMFLLNQAVSSSDFNGCVDYLRQVFDRAGAKVEAMSKWDERKLAYPIEGQRRGTFILAYFHARGSQIVNIERDCQLSEQVLRTLILRPDHLGDLELDRIRKEGNIDLERALRSDEMDEGEFRGVAGDDLDEQPASALSAEAASDVESEAQAPADESQTPSS